MEENTQEERVAIPAKTDGATSKKISKRKVKNDPGMKLSPELQEAAANFFIALTERLKSNTSVPVPASVSVIEKKSYTEEEEKKEKNLPDCDYREITPNDNFDDKKIYQLLSRWCYIKIENYKAIAEILHQNPKRIEVALGAKHEVLRILGIIAAQDHLINKKVRKAFVKNISIKASGFVCFLSLEKLNKSNCFSDEEKKKILTRLIKQIEKYNNHGLDIDFYSPPSNEFSPRPSNFINCEDRAKKLLDEIEMCSLRSKVLEKALKDAAL